MAFHNKTALNPYVDIIDDGVLVYPARFILWHQLDFVTKSERFGDLLLEQNS